MKTCTRCRRQKPLTEFYPQQYGAHGVMARCKECEKKAKRDYRKANIDRMRELDRLSSRFRRQYQRDYRRAWRRKQKQQ